MDLSKSGDSLIEGLSDIEKERTASLVLESYVQKGNPPEPGLTAWMSPTQKFAGDNPYTIYTQAPVDSNFEYKHKGKLGNAMYLGFQIFGYANGFNLPTANLAIKNIVLNDDNTFEIYLSLVRPESAKNWISLADVDHAFIVREYFKERNSVIPAELKIERVDNSSSSVLSYLKRLERVNLLLKDYMLGSIDLV